MAAVVVLIPVLRRPHRVVPLLASIHATTPEPYRVLFICTHGDTEEHAAIDRQGAERITLPGEHSRGDYAKKINYGYRETDEPLLFLGADDVEFYPNWFERAAEKLTDTIHVVGTNDLGSPRVITGEHATHSLVTRAYVDEFGTIDERGKVLHEGYWHEFVDDEFVETARYRNAFAAAHYSLVEHLHPCWLKAPTDPLYDMQRKRMMHGRRLYKQRRRMWA